MSEPAGSSTGPAGSDSLPAASQTDADLTEVVVESEVLRRGHYLTFRVDTIERPDGTRAKREVVGHPGAVAILAIDEADNVLMVRQFRIPAGRALLEVPAGTLGVDPQTGATEDPALAAPRELEEETGYRAGSWRLLTSFWTAPGFATEYMHLYLATDLQPAHENRLGPDEDERLQLERVPWQEAIDRAERGDITDAKSLIALLWLDRLTQPAAAATETAAPADAAKFDAIVRAQFTPTAGDAVRAAVANAQSSIWIRASGIALLVLAIAFGIGGNLTLSVYLGVIGLFIATGLYLVPFAFAASRRHRALYGREIHFAAGATGVDYRSPIGHSEVPWSAFRAIRESAGFFFLDAGVSVISLPKRALTAGDLSSLRRLIAEAGFGPDGRRR